MIYFLIKLCLIMVIECLRPVPTGLISRRPTAIVGQRESADSGGFKILNNLIGTVGLLLQNRWYSRPILRYSRPVGMGL